MLVWVSLAVNHGTFLANLVIKKEAIPKYLGTASGWYYKRLPLTYQCIEQGGQAQANQDEGEDHIPVI